MSQHTSDKPRSHLIFWDVSVKLQVDALSMRSHDGHSYACCGDGNIIGAPNLLGFFHHLHLLLIVPVLCHWAVVAEQVEGVLQKATNLIERTLTLSWNNCYLELVNAALQDRLQHSEHSSHLLDVIS